MTRSAAPPAVPTPGPALPHPTNGAASQATVIEQSRAIAEVHAAVMIAQNRPRDEERAIAAMKRACDRPSLANQAFYEYPRGGKSVVGPTVYLARELARIWGNIDHSVRELKRDETGSEMLAVAWDLETNTRVSTSWINPRKRYTGGAGILTEERDVQDNNSSVGARRVREQIFNALPQWFTEEAEEACRATIRREAETDTGVRIAKAVAGFGALGVTVDRLEAKVGKPRREWTPDDLAGLQITYKSISSGTLKKDEAFPVEVVDTTAAVAARREKAAAKPAGPETPAEVPSSAGPVAVPGDGKATPAPAAPDAGPVPPEASQKPARGRAVAGTARVLDETLKPGTKAWHDAQHPTPTSDGHVTTVPELLNGDCGVCEQGSSE